MFTYGNINVTIVNIYLQCYPFFMTKTYHHGDLKRAVLENAIETIQQRNAAIFTLREIAQHLKVSHTAVYRHFSSKHDLLSAIAHEGFQTLCSLFARELSELKDPQEKLLAISEAYIHFALEHHGHYRTMFHQELRCTVERQEHLEEAGNMALNYLLEAIDEGIKAKVFTKDDPQTLSQDVWSSLHGFSTLLIDGQFQSLYSKKKRDESISRHSRFILRGLLR